MEVTRPTPEAIEGVRAGVVLVVERCCRTIGADLVNKAWSDMAAATQ